MIKLVNEVQMIELENGDVMLNSRSADDKPFRKAATSRDGGQTWSKVEQVQGAARPGLHGVDLAIPLRRGARQGANHLSGQPAPANQRNDPHQLRRLSHLACQ